MVNDHLYQRLDGLHKHLMSVYESGICFSSASKGRERECFVNEFLGNILPRPYRFGSGDIIDQKNKSGQVDIVIEYPFQPSLPVFESGPRLYTAEGVAVALEVKSDVAKQWEEVLV